MQLLLLLLLHCLYPPVVPTLIVHRPPALLHCRPSTELPEVPELDGLVLAVGDEVPPVAFGRHVGQAVNMASQLPHWHGVVFPESSPVPDLAQSVVRSRGQDLSGGVQETHGVHVVVVGGNPGCPLVVGPEATDDQLADTQVILAC